MLSIIKQINDFSADAWNFKSFATEEGICEKCTLWEVKCTSNWVSLGEQYINTLSFWKLTLFI